MRWEYANYAHESENRACQLPTRVRASQNGACANRARVVEKNLARENRARPPNAESVRLAWLLVGTEDACFAP